MVLDGVITNMDSGIGLGGLDMNVINREFADGCVIQLTL